jgi:myo-inositol catabolism protein IolC
MTAIQGFDKHLYILSFDYRDLILAMSGPDDMLSAEHVAEIASARSQITAAKHVAYSGFKAALAVGVHKDEAGILVDEECGAEILRNAASLGYLTACPAEKSGREEFDFEFGEDFAKHIETFNPTFCKVQVRYNPEGDQDLNRRQSGRLKRLSDFLHRESRSLFLLELLLPPDKPHLKSAKKTSNLEIHPRLTIGAMQQLQDAQIEPDVWGIEGLDRREDCEKVVAAARRGGRDKVGCIILGGGEDQEKSSEQLKTAAGVPGFIGFATGRTIFSDTFARWVSREITSKGATSQIGRRYREFVNIFEKHRSDRVPEHVESPHQRTRSAG